MSCGNLVAGPTALPGNRPTPRRRERSRSLIMLALGASVAITTGAAADQGDAAATDRAKAITTVVGAPASANCAASAAAGRYDDEALGFCTRALENERLNRNNRIATRINRGAIYLRRGANNPDTKPLEGAAALADFDFVIAQDPNHPDAHLNRGTALIMLNKPGQAVAAITTALGLGLRAPQKAYLNRGAARESLGDLAGALEDYQTALAIDPGWAAAEAELARFAQTGRDRVAQRLRETAEDVAQRGAP